MSYCVVQGARWVVGSILHCGPIGLFYLNGNLSAVV